MCGIVGLVRSNRDAPIDPGQLARMRDSLEHRGPDDSGQFLRPGVALGSRRLSIVDLSPRGHMPMATADGRFWMVYNGEVYNFRELRAGLEARGETFVSETDSEVVLRSYALDGPKMLERLNGMFAFAIWDDRERELFIARDRLGIKPLYFAVRGGDLLFASEAKALIAAGVPAAFDESRLAELLCFRFVAGSNSALKGVTRLLPGHSLLWKDGAAAIRPWWNLSERVRAARESSREIVDAETWFQTTFDSSVLYRRISDVPVGVLLSGGLDSSSVAASLALQDRSRLASFTVSFEEREYDEAPLAREVAERYGFEFHHLRVPPEQVAEMLAEASYLNDEPLVHGNDVQLLALARFAKPRVTVLLSGEGGDETLGGYVRYRPLRHPWLLRGLGLVPELPGTSPRVRKLQRMARLGSIGRQVLFNACDVLPGDLAPLGVDLADSTLGYRMRIVEEAAALYPREPTRQAMYSDQHTFLNSILDRNDRMTMGASIECRVPFLDYRLVEGTAALPSRELWSDRRNKALMHNAIGARLPESVLSHRKWGFGVPWFQYLRECEPLAQWVRALPEREPYRSGVLDPKGLAPLIRRFFDGDRTTDLLVRQLLMLTAWYEAVVDGGVSSVKASAAARG